MNRLKIIQILRKEELIITNPTYAMVVNTISSIDYKEEEVMAAMIHSLCYCYEEVRRELVNYKVLYGELKDNDKI